ncbi:MAG: 7TM-DISM domain-containing protein [Brachymonas sp.]
MTLPSLFKSSKLLPLEEALRFFVTAHDDPIRAQDLATKPASQWAVVQPSIALPTSNMQVVWLRLVLPVSSSPQTWMLRIPRQSLQKATLYSRDNPQAHGKANRRVKMSRTKTGLCARANRFLRSPHSLTKPSFSSCGWSTEWQSPNPFS